jgi:hypothetical protein
MLRGLLASLCVVAGCGKVQVVGNNPDAPAPDADLHGLAHITVLDVLGNGALAPNIPVVFINADDTIAGDTMSDSNGRAQADILPGASVTVVFTQITGSGASMQTFYLTATVFGINPGDDIPFGFTDRDGTQSSTFNVTFTALAGATSYEIFTPCGQTFSSTAGTVATSMQNGCKQDTFDVYVVASNSSGVAIDSAQLQNVSLAAGAATVPNSWIPFSSFTAAFTDIPSDVKNLQVSRQSSTGRGFTISGSCTAPLSATCSINAQAPTAGVKSFVHTTVGRTDARSTQQVITQRVAGNTINYNLDVGTNLLPWMSDVTFDPATGTTTPTLEAPDDQADFFFTEVSWNRDANTSLDWAVFTKTTGPTKFPTLPAHVGPLAPAAGDNSFNPTAITIDSTNVMTYDAVRPKLFALLDSRFFFNTDDDLIRSQTLQGATVDPPAP